MIRLGVLTIPSGQTESNILDGHDARWTKSIFIHPPAVLAGVTTVATSPKSQRDNKGAPVHVFQTLQSDGADVVVTDDKVLVLTEAGFGSLRLETTAAPGADEDYVLSAQDDPGF